MTTPVVRIREGCPTRTGSGNRPMGPVPGAGGPTPARGRSSAGITGGAAAPRSSAAVGSSDLPRREIPRRIHASGIGRAYWKSRKSMTPALISAL